jgi:hypothetical protein
MRKKYLGYQPHDQTTEYAKYYNETIQAIAYYVRAALNNSPFPAGSLPPFSQATALQKQGYTHLETGYTLESDGSALSPSLQKCPM